MPLIHTECLTLRRRRTRDADALVTLFCQDCGKVTASLKSVLKTTSRFAGVTQPFNRLHVVLYAKTEDQEIWTLTQAALIRRYPALQHDLSRMAYASCLAEWIDLLSGEFDSGTEVWDLLVNVFERWETQSPTWEELFYYQWRLLRDAGVQPEIAHCFRCKQDEPGAWYYRPEHGGILCESCRRKAPHSENNELQRDAKAPAAPRIGSRWEGKAPAAPGTLTIPLSAGAVQALRKLSESSQPPRVCLSTNQKNEITLLLKSHLEYYMGVQSKSNLFLEQMDKTGEPL